MLNSECFEDWCESKRAARGGILLEDSAGGHTKVTNSVSLPRLPGSCHAQAVLRTCLIECYLARGESMMDVIQQWREMCSISWAHTLISFRFLGQRYNQRS